jgi:hypothetical protein
VAGFPEHGQFFFARQRGKYCAFHKFHGRFQQNSARMTTGVTDDVLLFFRVGHRPIRYAGQLQSLGIHPQGMFAGVVNDQRSVGDGSVQKFV